MQSAEATIHTPQSIAGSPTSVDGSVSSHQSQRPKAALLVEKDPLFKNALENIYGRAPPHAQSVSSEHLTMTSKSLLPMPKVGEIDIEDVFEDLILWTAVATGSVDDFSPADHHGPKVWKVTQFKLSNVDSDQFGTFSTGDVFIVLFVRTYFEGESFLIFFPCCSETRMKWCSQMLLFCGNYFCGSEKTLIPSRPLLARHFAQILEEF